MTDYAESILNLQEASRRIYEGYKDKDPQLVDLSLAVIRAALEELERDAERQVG